MRVLVLSNGINCVLDPCLIFGLGPFPRLGVMGAAVATCTGRGLGVLYQLWHLRSGRHRIVLRGDALRFDPRAAFNLLKLSAGGIGQMLIATCSWMALFRITAGFGKEAVAGYTIGVRILVFTILPAWGLANAAATLVGQNLGAGDPARAERAVWLTGTYNMVFLGSVTLLMIGCAGPLADLFTDDAAVRPYAVACVRTLAYGYPLYAWGMVTVQALNGAGDTLTPTWINLFCFWVLELPLAYVLARPAGWGPDGVFWSVAIAESLMAVIAFQAFRSGRWKLRKI
jgi:putative MATE family efflux protein